MVWISRRIEAEDSRVYTQFIWGPAIDGFVSSHACYLQTSVSPLGKVLHEQISNVKKWCSEFFMCISTAWLSKLGHGAQHLSGEVYMKKSLGRQVAKIGSVCVIWNRRVESHHDLTSHVSCGMKWGGNLRKYRPQAPFLWPNHTFTQVHNTASPLLQWN